MSNHMSVSTDAEKAFNQIHNSFLTKTLDTLRIKGNFLNLIKNIYQKAYS